MAKIKCKFTVPIIFAIISAFIALCLMVTGGLTIDTWRQALWYCDGPDKDTLGYRYFGEPYQTMRCARIDCYTAIGSFGVIIGLIQMCSTICLLYELIAQLPRAELFPWIITFNQMKKIWVYIHFGIFVLLAVPIVMAFALQFWIHGSYETALLSFTLIDMLWCGAIGIYYYRQKHRKKNLPIEFYDPNTKEEKKPKRKKIKFTTKIIVSLVLGLTSVVIGLALICVSVDAVSRHRAWVAECDKKGSDLDATACRMPRLAAAMGGFGIIASLFLLVSFASICYQEFFSWIFLHFLSFWFAIGACIFNQVIYYDTVDHQRGIIEETIPYMAMYILSCAAWIWCILSSGILIIIHRYVPRLGLKIKNRFTCKINLCKCCNKKKSRNLNVKKSDLINTNL